MNEIRGPIKTEVHAGQQYTAIFTDTATGKAVNGDQINALLAERDRLKECHEAELGVCHQYCDEVISLQNKLAAYAELREAAEEYRNAQEVWDILELDLSETSDYERYRRHVQSPWIKVANLFAALDKLEE